MHIILALLTEFISVSLHKRFAVSWKLLDWSPAMHTLGSSVPGMWSLHIIPRTLHIIWCNWFCDSLTLVMNWIVRLYSLIQFLHGRPIRSFHPMAALLIGWIDQIRFQCMCLHLYPGLFYHSPIPFHLPQFLFFLVPTLCVLEHRLLYWTWRVNPAPKWHCRLHQVHRFTPIFVYRLMNRYGGAGRSRCLEKGCKNRIFVSRAGLCFGDGKKVWTHWWWSRSIKFCFSQFQQVSLHVPNIRGWKS